MKHLKTLLILLAISLMVSTQAQDWANLSRYKGQNAELLQENPPGDRVVFMGNSITDAWIIRRPEFFEGRPYIDRGISGQTTPQMLVRFRQDVIELKPAVVVILAGTNDIAGNTGPATLEQIAGNIISMIELAEANDINVVLCSVLPVIDYKWRPGQFPASKIVKLNEALHAYARKNKIVYVDYHSAMANEEMGLKKELGKDGVHPNIDGYAIMEPLVEKGIKKALKKR